LFYAKNKRLFNAKGANGASFTALINWGSLAARFEAKPEG